MELKINQSDLNRIVGKLNTVAQRAPKHRWPFIVEILDQYGKTVTNAMASVEGLGGDARISFRGLDGYAKEESQYWPALSPFTIAKKRGYEIHSRQDLLDIYDVFASAVRIWHYTGASYQAVASTTKAAKAGGTFVGIENADYAAAVELGDPARKIPKRPLFAVVNDLVRVYIQRELRKPASGLQKRIRQELVELARECGWGNG